MTGYFDERFTTSSHDPLKATAIILPDGQEKFDFTFRDLGEVTLPVTTNARGQSGVGEMLVETAMELLKKPK